ncbi:MAG TPA: hypothetical protein VKZ89_09765, partial [Thermobifida alba]|nr:hypothetical protein [Thermobifida alba]
MIIVCLVLVVAAFVVIGAALVLAELTLVNIALGLGGLAAVLLAVEFVRNRRTLFGQGRVESPPDHRTPGLHGTVTGQVRTDDLGKASVQSPSTVAATGRAVPTAGVGGPPVAVQDAGDRAVVAEPSVPAPVPGPVRAASAPSAAVETEVSGAGGSRAEPHGSTAVDPSEEEAETVRTELETASEEAASSDTDGDGTAGDGDPDEVAASGGNDVSDEDDVPEESAAPEEADADLPPDGSGAEDAAADTGTAPTPDADATQVLPVLSGEPHGSTAVEDHDPADGTTGDGDAPEETPETRSEDDAAADTGARDSADEPEAPVEETPEAAPDAAADTGSRDAAVAGTAVDEPEARTTGHDGSDDADTADGPDTDPAGTETDETDAIAFREPAEWDPPFTLPSKEQRENKNVSAAAIAALAARWTPTGDDLAS